MEWLAPGKDHAGLLSVLEEKFEEIWKTSSQCLVLFHVLQLFLGGDRLH